LEETRFAAIDGLPAILAYYDRIRARPSWQADLRTHPVSIAVIRRQPFQVARVAMATVFLVVANAPHGLATSFQGTGRAAGQFTS